MMENNDNTMMGAMKEKKSLFGMLTIFLMILSIFVIFKTIGAYKENAYIGQNGANLMSFSGQGEVFAVADIATFNFSVTEESATTAQAQEASAEKVNAILAYLEDQGIEDKDIKTTNYNVYPRYEWNNRPCSQYYCPEGERVLAGYEVSQTVMVKVRDTGKAGTLLSGVGELGATNISGLSFSVDNQDELKREARKLAIEDAKTKAEDLAKDLGVDLVRIVNFNESGVYPMYNKSYESAPMGMGGDGAIVEPEIPVGENKITSNITITYQIK